MNDNEQLIHDLYTAFQQRDGGKMAALYSPEAVFSDPAFDTLHGREIGAMWRMLCARGKDLRVVFDNVQAEGRRGRAHWEAWYTFSSTGRQVHNVIEASFKFADERILEHHDRFSFWRWSSMALGPLGLFAGWLPLVQNRVHNRARQGLMDFMKREEG